MRSFISKIYEQKFNAPFVFPCYPYENPKMRSDITKSLNYIKALLSGGIFFGHNSTMFEM